MSWKIVRILFSFVVSYYQATCRNFLWRGRRIFAIDGTKLTLPSSCKGKKYILPSPDAYYPQALLTVLYQLKAGIPYDAQFCRHVDERKAARHHFSHLKSGDVLVLDRGFFPYR